MGPISQAKLFIFVLIFVAMINSCSHGTKKTTGTVQFLPQYPYEPVKPVDAPLNFCKVWEKNLTANLSYLSVSEDGSKYLVSTSANKGRPKGVEAKISVISKDGKLIWSQWSKQPIRGQSISKKGEWVAFSNYEDKTFFYNTKGSKYFERSNLGFPHIFEDLKNVLIFNDDDSEPDVAFTVYDFSGKKVTQSKVPSGREPVDLSYYYDVDQKKSYIALALSGRNQEDDKWIIKTINDEKISNGTFEGEPVSIALFQKEKLFILYSDPIDPSLQRVRSISVADGKKLWDIELDKHYEVIRLANANSENESFLLLYGNQTRGQSILGLDLTVGKALFERSYPTASIYSSPVLVAKQSKGFSAMAVIIIDTASGESQTPAGTLTLMGLNREGKALFTLPVLAPDGIYSYSINFENNPEVLVGLGEPGNSTIVQFEKCK